MTHRPTRLFVIKFLGLWGASKTTDRKGEENDSSSEGHRQPFSQNIHELGTMCDAEIRPKYDSISGIKACSRKVVGLMLEKGVPGLTVQVSLRGQTVWKAAFGFCDVENQVACVPEAHMRIASISKPLFVTTVVAPMIEQDKINLKASVHEYLSPEEFPKQHYQGDGYDIRVEQLLSHTSGIKHYVECPTLEDPLRPICSDGSMKIHQNDDQYNKQGFYQQKTYRNVMEALEPFRDEPLVNRPGNFNYTTYGFTLLSAVAQKVHQRNVLSESEQIEDFWVKTLHRDWGMDETYLDHDEVIIPNRARYYLRSGQRGELINAPYANNSVKWAGGGIISTVNDLVKFGNHLIESYKEKKSAKLKRVTIKQLWRRATHSYGLGFAIKGPDIDLSDETLVYHSGSALGASSILIVYPETEIVVAILVNLGHVNLKTLALSMADEFIKLNK